MNTGTVTFLLPGVDLLGWWSWSHNNHPYRIVVQLESKVQTAVCYHISSFIWSDEVVIEKWSWMEIHNPPLIQQIPLQCWHPGKVRAQQQNKLSPLCCSFQHALLSQHLANNSSSSCSITSLFSLASTLGVLDTLLADCTLLTDFPGALFADCPGASLCFLSLNCCGQCPACHNVGISLSQEQVPMLKLLREP